MKRKIFSILGVCVFLCLAKNAFADVVNYNWDFVNAYTVDNNGSEAQKTVFNWDEKPWLFLEIPGSINYDWDATISTWSWSGGQAHSTTLGVDPVYYQGNKLWLSFSDSRWSQFDKEGNWIISPTSVLIKGSNLAGVVSGQTSCTVTPEPLSAGLFLIGTGALAVLRKKKA